MKIRTARLGDLAAIVELAQESPTAAQRSEASYKTILEEDHPRRSLLVAETENKAAGFLAARIVADECELEDIVVSLAKRRRGVASELLNKLISIVPECQVHRIFLEVRESNLAACCLYEKFGFVGIGCRTDYYRTPRENACLYSLDL